MKKCKCSWVGIVLCCMIAIQLFHVIYLFEVKKKEYHSDELFSYAYSNDFDAPLISATTLSPKEYEEYLNRNEWLDAQTMKNHFVVAKGQQFAYRSVYRNNAKDVHPVLFNLILHTISSFFPGTYSEWFGLSINLVCMAITVFMIFLCLKAMTQNEILALIGCAFYGFCLGGIDTFLFIRMYGLSTCLGTILLYLHIRLYQEWSKKTLIGCGIVTLLGAATHYYFIVFAFFLAASYCIYYCCKKQFVPMLQYGITELLGVVGSFAININFWTHLTSIDEVSPNKGMWFEHLWAKFIVIKELTGITVPIRPSYFGIYLTEFLLAFFVIAAPVAFLCRKEKWFHTFCILMKNGLLSLWHQIRKVLSPAVIGMVVANVGTWLLICRTAGLYRMADTAVRYFFILYPSMIILGILVTYIMVQSLVDLLDFLWKSNPWKRWKNWIVSGVILLIAMGILVYQHATTESAFLFNDIYDASEIKNDELPMDCNYILMPRTVWVSECLSFYLKDADHYFLTGEAELTEKPVQEQLRQLPNDKPVYLLVEVPGWTRVAEEEDEEFDFEQLLLYRNESQNIQNEQVKQYLQGIINNIESVGIAQNPQYLGKTEFYGYFFFFYQIR